MYLTTNNQSNVDSVAVLNSSWIKTVSVYNRESQMLVVGATGISVDFWSITAPTYIKIIANNPINLTIGTLELLDVTEFELKGLVQDITMKNTSTTEETTVDFLVAK